MDDTRVAMLAEWIWEQEENGFPVTAAEVQRRNKLGWTLTTVPPRDPTRYESVVFTDDEITEAQARVATLRRNTDAHS